MKIDVRSIPASGLILTEEFSPQELDLDTEIIKFSGPIRAKAVISKSYNAVGVDLTLSGAMRTICSRCLEKIDTGFNRQAQINYAVDNLEPVIELDPDIREEIILNYPMKPLCKDSCMGLCPKCGGNLNEGGCNCGST